MAAPGGKTGGRVSIRVIPDATKFRNDLQLMLKRVEQSMSANLAVTADTRPAEATLRRFQKNWNGQQVSLDAVVATAGASGALAFVSRTRIATIAVRVSKSSLAKASTILASLAGARLAGDFIKNISERLQNLDRSLPKLAAVGLGIANIGSVALSAVGGIFTLGSGLAKVLGLAAVLPGLLVGLATGGVVLGVALSDTKVQLAELAPAFQDLRAIITGNFWAKARQPILDFVNNVLPNFQTGLGNTSDAVGNWASSVVAGFQSALGGGLIDTLFGRLVDSINIASTGTGGFAKALVTLGEIGSRYLPRLAQWVADLSNRFGDFIIAAEADGRITSAIDAGITAAQLLGSVLGSLVSIWSGISEAAEAAGGGGLSAFAGVLASIAEIVNGPQFQATMSTIFGGAAAGASGLAAALGPIGDFFSAFAPTLATILEQSGSVVGQVLGSLATAMSDPAFTSGLGLFFAGIQSGLKALEPSLPALAEAFGAVAAFAGQLASQLGPVLGAVITALAPILVQLLSAISPLLPVLGTALISIIKALAPLFLDIATNILPLVIDMFTQLVPMLLPLIEQILPIIAALLPVAAAGFQALLPILGPLLSVLQPILELLSAILLPLLPLLIPLIQFLADNLALVANIISGVVQTAIQLLVGLFTGDMAGALEKIGGIWTDIWGNMQTVFEDVWNGIVGFGQGIFNFLLDIVEGGVNGFIDLINGIRNAALDIVNNIAGALGISASITVGNIPHVNVPRLAIGADILPSPGGTAVVLGEGRRRETVTDYGRTNRLIEVANQLALRALTVGSGEGATVNVYPGPGMDEREVGLFAGRELADRMQGR